MERPSGELAGGAKYNFTKQPFAAELPGLSAFALEDDVVYRAYSCYARGLDAFNAASQLLDRAPRGRDATPRHTPRWCVVSPAGLLVRRRRFARLAAPDTPALPPAFSAPSLPRAADIVGVGLGAWGFGA
jgi:hypothetical protein